MFKRNGKICIIMEKLLLLLVFNCNWILRVFIFLMIFLIEGILGVYVIFLSIIGLRFFYKICVWIFLFKKFIRFRYRGFIRIDI